MDYMIWLVAIALLGYVVYAAMTAPPSSGCLSADLARARDEAKQRAMRRDNRSVVPPVAPDSMLTEEPPGMAPGRSGETAGISTMEGAPIQVAASDAPEAAAATGDALRNPETGELAAMPTNYRFAKRWVKEALVTEGLLEKIYPNSELDAERAEEVRLALAAFKALGKYRA